MSRNYSITNNKKKKFNSDFCDNNMTFQDCELAVLRHAVDESEKIKGEQVHSGDVQK